MGSGWNNPKSGIAKFNVSFLQSLEDPESLKAGHGNWLQQGSGNPLAQHQWLSEAIAFTVASALSIQTVFMS